MNWEQKLEAMQALCGKHNVSLCMRRPGDWYVEVINRSIGGDGLLRGSFGNGATPEEAVNDDWRQYVDELPNDRHIVLNSNGVRSHWQWNGYRWVMHKSENKELRELRDWLIQENEGFYYIMDNEDFDDRTRDECVGKSDLAEDLIDRLNAILQPMCAKDIKT